MVVIEQLLEPYINAPVECDGFTRLAHTALELAGIQHTCMVGIVASLCGHRQSPIHFWIQLHDGRLIDYRARMWLGDETSVPHGVFALEAFPEWEYRGAEIDLPILNPVLARYMVMPLPEATAQFVG